MNDRMYGPQNKNEINEKVEALIAKMTLTEKIGQLNQIGSSIYKSSIEINDQMVREGKIGSFLSIRDISKINYLQDIAVNQTRLGIPLLFGHDILHGHKTVYPIPLAESCSWDIHMAEKTAAVTADEATANGIKWVFAPMVDIARDPRWGRIAEGFGEDPYLASAMGAAKVRGFQGRDNDLANRRRVAACPKHFVGYGLAEGGRDYNRVDVSYETIFDTCLPPFRAAVEAGAATIMTAFNDINGIPCTANKFLLTDVLREDMGFDGLVVSDSKAVSQLMDHGYADNERECACLSLSAGCDIDMNGNCYIEHIEKLVTDGVIKEEFLDEKVRNVLRIKFLCGLFENPFADEERMKKDILTPYNISIAKKSAERSIVLLKNEDHTLPISKSIRNLAVIGPLADDRHEIIGMWSCDGEDKDAVSVLEGIRSAVSEDTKIIYEKGCEITGNNKQNFGKAVKAAENANAIIAVIGESRGMSGEAHSRSSINIPGVQEDLIKELLKTKKPLVAVLMNGRPLAIPFLKKEVPAVLEAWHLGIQTGPAVASVIFGDYNPSGKLTTTFVNSTGQIPMYYNHFNTGRPADEERPWSSKYIDAPIEPLFPFGYGLSYTTFEYKNLEIENPRLCVGDKLRASVEVVNTGEYDGEEIVQLYIRDLVGSRVRPVKELKAFQKLLIKKGETQKVRFEVETDTMGFYNRKLEYVVETGKFDIWIGPNSKEGVKGSFMIV